ncbi:MAG: D-alanyl-D-alanine carboxypeptidase/D-alanyl-D-alanine-endopeptidase [Lentisphaeria bacterium]|nr:D-alanyl-D-alanine carboxypeptidase/D-alanyl-D-alanine-endopeptidase [Lentisphaeria bacterium]
MSNERLFRGFVIMGLVIVLGACSYTHNATPVKKVKLLRNQYEEAAYQIDTLLNNSPFDMAYWGVKVVRATTGEVIYERNAGKMFMPASNMKLYTTAAALCMLGPEYTYETTFWTDGKIDEQGVLNGNLFVQGSADPTWSWRFHDDNYDSLFIRFADSLKARGIKKINGAIVGDDNIFEDEPLGYGWSWDDEPYYYGAQISGLSFNENYIDHKIVPSKIGEPVEIIPYPDTDYLTVEDSLITVGPDSATKYNNWRKRAKNEGWYKGVWSQADSVGWDALTVENPTLFTVYVLKQYLERNGIEVGGEPVDVDDWMATPDYGRYQPLFTHNSHPMWDIIEKVNKPSQNFIAETLQRTLGAEFGEKGTDREGIKVQMALYDSLGMDTRNLTIRDGSGLSRLDLVSPNTTVSLLQMMWDHPDRDLFIVSLPQAGVDGTTENRMKGMAAAGRVRAKTGYISYVRSLSGYLWTMQEEPVIFSLMVNHYTVPTSWANYLQDRICNILVTMDE